MMDLKAITRERKNVLYHNLLYLGTDDVLFDKKYHVNLHKNMFEKPNRKGFEAVTHFLFSTLSAITRKEYSLPWPLLDKEASRMFQKMCFNHLTNFSGEGIVKFPRIVPSFLSSFGGERFYEIYMAFSTYVLIKKMNKDSMTCLTRPVVSSGSFRAVQNALQLSTISHFSNIKETISLMCACMSDWMKISENLSQCSEELKKLLLIAKEDKTRDLKSLKELLSIPQEEKIALKNICRKTYELTESKKRLKMNNFFLIEKKLWSFMESEIGSEATNITLNIEEFDAIRSIPIPDELSSELEKLNEVDEKLTVSGCIKLLFVCIKFKINILITEASNICSLHEICTASQEEASAAKECFVNSVKLLNRLLDIEIPSIEKNIGNFNESNFSDSSNIGTPTYPVPHIPVESFSSEDLNSRLTHFEPGDWLYPILSRDDSSAVA